jgi:hypothetical protein
VTDRLRRKIHNCKHLLKDCLQAIFPDPSWGNIHETGFERQVKGEVIADAPVSSEGFTNNRIEYQNLCAFVLFERFAP